MSDDIICAVENCEHEAEIEVERQGVTLWLCIPHRNIFIPKPVKHIIHETHSHCYDIDASELANFIKLYPGIILLAGSDNQYIPVTTWDIIRLLQAFREQTLPKGTSNES